MLAIKGAGGSLLFLQLSGSPPWGLQSPLTPALSLGPHSIHGRQMFCFPRGSWDREGPPDLVTQLVSDGAGMSTQDLRPLCSVSWVHISVAALVLRFC